MLLALVLTGTFWLPSCPSHAETVGFLSVRDTWVTGADGRVVLLRGVNYVDFDDHPESHREADFARFAKMGFNVVRFPISWSRLEPVQGVIDISYLTKYVSRDVEWAKKYGLYVVLNIHQFKWAERFGGSGAPEWAVSEYARNEGGMREAVSSFWIDGEIQYHFIRLWTEIARLFSNEPTIAGYDILNEPWLYTSVIPGLDATYIDLLYLKVIKAIRTVDRSHIIFLEPANTNTFKLRSKEKVVWSPHFYPLSFASHYSSQDVERLEADLEAKYRRFVIDLKTPMWIGEFGASMHDEESRSRWLKDAIRLFDKYKVGWAWWPSSDEQIRNIPSWLAITPIQEEATKLVYTTVTVGMRNPLDNYLPVTLVVIDILIIYIIFSQVARRKSHHD